MNFNKMRYHIIIINIPYNYYLLRVRKYTHVYIYTNNIITVRYFLIIITISHYFTK